MTWKRIAKTLALLLLLLSWCTPLRADETVRLLYFYDPRCGSCQEVHREVIEPLMAELGARLAVEEYDVSTPEGLERMMDMEDQLQVYVTTIPAAFVGEDAFIGPESIFDGLRESVMQHLAGDAAAPGSDAEGTPEADCDECGDIHAAARAAAAQRRGAAEAAPPIHVAYFYQPGCDECERSEHDLAYIQAKYPQVEIHRFNVQQYAALNQYLCLQAEVPEAKHLTAPSLFVGQKGLVGSQVRAREIEALLIPHLEQGLEASWEGWQEHSTLVEETIVERFRSFGLLTVIGAGLLDGVNPCAFATMIFLISYLSMRKRQGAALLATGAAFTLGVFLTYLGVGFGFLRFLASLPFLHVIGKWIYGLTAALCLALAYGSVMDYRKAKEGRLADMSLKLPEKLRGWSKTLIREGTGTRRFVLSSLILGFGVSIIELACTGQVYLPTIIFVLGIPEWRAQAGWALLLYNIMFILPLVIVFLTVYWGTTSQQLIDWMTRHTAGIKLGTAALFVLLAGWLVASIVML